MLDRTFWAAAAAVDQLDVVDEEDNDEDEDGDGDDDEDEAEE